MNHCILSIDLGARRVFTVGATANITGAQGLKLLRGPGTWIICFLAEKCEVKDVDDGKSENATVLVAYDELKEAFWTVNAPRKGAVHGVVQWCVDKLEDSGYGGNDITVKSDQEESMCALRWAIAVMRKGGTTPIH